MNLIDQMNSLQVQPGCLAIWGLGQMGFAVKGGEQVIYIDPILSDIVAIRFPENGESFHRAYPAPLRPEEVTNAHYVLCSHEHLDHTDPLTLGPLFKASSEAEFVVSGWAHEQLEEAGIPRERWIIPHLGQPIQLGDICITAIPAAHYSLDEDEQMGCRFMSFLIEWNGVRLFHSGDTLIVPRWLDGLRSLPKIDIGILAANGRDPFRDAKDVLGNLTPEEAVWVAKEFGWDVLIGGHNDLFPGNRLPAGELAEAVRRLSPLQKFHTLQPGELYYYVSPR